MKSTISMFRAILALTLIYIGGSQSRAAETSPTDPKVTAAITVIEDANSDVLLKFKACEDLQKLGPKAAPAVPALIAMMKANPDTQSAAATVFSLIGPGAAKAVPALIDATRSNDATTRGCAASALGAIGPDATSAGPALIKLLGDPDKFVRTMAIGALHRVALSATDKAAAIEKLRQVEANDADDSVRDGAKLEITLLQSDTTFAVLHGVQNAPEPPIARPAANQTNPLDSADTAREANPLDPTVPDTTSTVDARVGSFSNDKLTIQLAAATEKAGEYTGFIKLAGQQFPLRAKAAANNSKDLSGTFTSNTGKAFDFAASLEADQQTLTLTTGRTNYTLKRTVAPAGEKNPLDP